MPRTSRTEYAVLGLLAMGPRTGYDIKREVSDVIGHFWHESFGNLYPVLHRLYEQGLVERRTEPGDAGPPRRVYSITADGRSELEEWLRSPVIPVAPRNELPLRIFFGEFLSSDDLARVLRDYRDRQAAVLTEIEEAAAALRDEAADEPGLVHWLRTIDLGRRSMATVIEWCDETIEELTTA